MGARGGWLPPHSRAQRGVTLSRARARRSLGRQRRKDGYPRPRNRRGPRAPDAADPLYGTPAMGARGSWLPRYSRAQRGVTLSRARARRSLGRQRRKDGYPRPRNRRGPRAPDAADPLYGTPAMGARGSWLPRYSRAQRGVTLSRARARRSLGRQRRKDGYPRPRNRRGPRAL